MNQEDGMSSPTVTTDEPRTDDVMTVILDLAREALRERDRVIAGGWVVSPMPHDEEVRAWLASTPTASATGSAVGGASSQEAKKTTMNDAALPAPPDHRLRDMERLRKIETAARTLRVETFGRMHNDEAIEAAWDVLRDALDLTSRTPEPS